MASDEITDAILNHTITDIWEEAKMGEVLEYLYSNRSLELTSAQKERLRVLAKAWEH